MKKEYVCEICGKSFKTIYRKEAHISGVHEKKKPYKCGKCGDAYKYQSGLRVHRNSGYCPGAPRKENKWIYWGKDGSNSKCLHPDCIGKDYGRFSYGGIMKHIIDLHSPGADDSVSNIH